MIREVRRYLERLRLTRRSLIKMAAAIFGAFVVLSIGISWILPTGTLRERAVRTYYVDGPEAGERALVEHLESHPDDAEGWLELARKRAAMRAGSLFLGPTPDFEELMRSGELVRTVEDEDRTPFLDDAAFDRLLSSCPVLPPEVLRAHRDALIPGTALAHLDGLEDVLAAQVAGGTIALESGKPEEALPYFRRALDLEPRNREAATGLVRALDRAESSEELEAVLADAAIRAAIDPDWLFEHHRERKEYFRSFPPLIRGSYETITPGLLVTCLVIGAAWALLVFHMGFGWFWRRPIRWLAPIALVAGWISADLTLPALIVTDDWVGEDFRSGVTFHILYSLVIGFREELIKLALFLPFVPYLVRMGSEVQAIVIASLVGLGFAVRENTSYYLVSDGQAIIGRFVTANFLHLALTGFAGYYLVRAIRRGGEDWGEFFGALAKVIVFHAAYDFFLIEPSLSDYSIISMILFILISQQYLRLFHHIRPHRVHRVSLTRIFVASLATVIGMHYLYLSTQMGIGEALWYTTGGVLGYAIITFMYFQEFDERVA